MSVKAVRSHVWLAPWVVTFLVFAGKFWFLCDDAYISFRFSRNWARGLGVVFNPGDVPPVEGYSNFLWVAIGALVEASGLPIPVVLPVLSLLCGVGLLIRIGQVATALSLPPVGRHLAVAAFALSPPSAVWATSGLATMPFAWVFFELVVWVVLPSVRPGGPEPRGVITALALVMALLRVEGPLWVGFVAALGVAAHAWRGGGIDPDAMRGWVAPGLVGAFIYGVYTGWRIHHFGTGVPNTALVKVGLDPWVALRGLKYVVVFLITTVVPVAGLVAGARLQTDRRLAPLLFVVVAILGYAVLVGGDFMPFGRLIVPALPFVGLLIGAAAWPRLGMGLVAVGALPLLGLHPVPSSLLRPLHFRHSDVDFMSELDRWANQRDNLIGFARRGRALAAIAEPGDAVVAGAVGAIGYASGLEVLDQHGLVTKEVAYRSVPSGPLRTSPGHDKHVPPSFFVKYAPRFLYARTVAGPLAAGRMKDTLVQWRVPSTVQDRYVPDFWEVTEPDDAERTFLLVVRRCTDDEDPALVWNGFAGRRRSLNAELRDARVTQGASP